MVSAILGLGMLVLLLGFVVLVAKVLILVLLTITDAHNRRRWHRPHRNSSG